ncbi:MAG: Hpt domain-containing protein, partial [Planctomycetes bacterium]|nr:Hpt domain-containing protein [Planctomycetota bacterium]
MPQSIEELLLEAFAEESAELLGRISAALVDLEHAEGATFTARLSDLRRDVHTLKGSAGAVGRREAMRLCHAAEDRLGDAVRNGALAATTLDALHRAVNALESLCTGAGSDVDLDALIDALDQVVADPADKADAGAAPAPAVESPAVVGATPSAEDSDAPPARLPQPAPRPQETDESALAVPLPSFWP